MQPAPQSSTSLEPITWRANWWREAARLTRLGSPILIGQLAQTAMGVTDTLMAGHYSATDLAAIAIGQSLWLPIFIFFVGLFNATTTNVAHQFGALDKAAIRHTVTQSLWLAVIGAPLGILLLLGADTVTPLLSIEADVANITHDYLFYLACGLPPALAFLCLRAFSEGMGHTRPIMLINILALLINIPLNYAFIFGKFGAPAMGGAGCGVATALVLWLQLIVCLRIVGREPRLKEIKLFSRLSLAPKLDTLKSLLALGLPIALTFVAEVSLFSVVALIIAPLGTAVIAGHQITLSVSTITFMLPLSVGMAITIQTGQYLGAGQPQQAKFSSLVGLSIALLLATGNMLLILSLRHWIPQLYTQDQTVIAIAYGLLFFTAIYQLPDAVQIAMTSALRGYRDTRLPLVIVLVAYWLISVPLGWQLTYGSASMGAGGMWMGLVCGLSFAAVLQSWRFLSLTRIHPRH